MIQYLGPLIVARVISVQQVTRSVFTIVPTRAASCSKDKAPQHCQGMVAPLSWQFRFQLPASCFTVEPANIGTELLSMF